MREVANHRKTASSRRRPPTGATARPPRAAAIRRRRGRGRLLRLVAVGIAAGGPLAAQTLEEARALHRADRLEEAVGVYRAVAAGSAADDPASAAVAHNNACVALTGLGEYEEAAGECREALRLRRALGEERGVARTLTNLGLALQSLGRYDQAATRLAQALEIHVDLDESRARVVTLGNLGVLATLTGRYSRAMSFHRAAIELAARHAGEPWAREQLQVAKINQGVVLEKLGAFREALDLYRQILSADGGELAPRRHATLLVNTGVVYRNLGDPRTAIRHLEEAVAIYRRLGDLSGLSNAHLNLALAHHLNLAAPAAAEAAYREALRLAVEASDRPEEIQDLFYLGRLLLEQGRLDEARALFERCRAAADESGSPEGRWSALEGLGRIAVASGDLDRGLRLFEEALAEIERTRAGVGEAGLRAGYFGDKRSVYAATVALLDRLRRRDPSGGHAGRALEVAQQAKARDLIDALGAGDLPALPATAAELRELAGDEPLIEYFVGERRLFRWVVDRRGIAMADLGEAQTLLTLAREAHAALAAGSAPGAELRGALARGLLGGARLGRAAGPLRIAPDGALRYLPYEILEDPDVPGRSLIEHRTVSYLPSAAALAWRRSTPTRPGLRLLGLGAPRAAADGGPPPLERSLLADRFDLPPLPASTDELANVGKRLGGRQEVYVGPRATEAAFRRAAGGATVVHLATHTVVDDRSGRGAAILLAPEGDDDGLLHPDEIAGLDLDTRLTVLASCSTGRDGARDGRALATLTGAFQAAGSDAVLSTLWDVGDRAAAAFMEQFYFQLARGLEPAEALRRAKLRLRSDRAWDRPHLWAAYVLVGDAPPVVGSTARGWAWAAAALVALAVTALVLARRRAP